MHRRSVILVALVLTAASFVPAGSAGATSGARPEAAARSDKKFCRAFENFVVYLRTAKKPSQLGTPKGKRILAAVLATRPKPVATETKTVIGTFVFLRDHGRRSASKARERATSAALVTVASYASDHCKKSKTLQSFAALLKIGQAADHARAAQSSLRDGLTIAKVINADTDSYLAVTPAALGDAEPKLDVVAGPTTPGVTTTVSVAVVDGTRIVLAAGNGQACFFIRDSTTKSGTQFATGPGPTCDASTPPTAWSTKGWR